MIWRALQLLGFCLLVPAILLHELTHYVMARNVADELRFDWNLSQPGVEVRWQADAPKWRLRLAKVAPTLVGVALAPLLLFYVIRVEGIGLEAAIVLAALWAVYTKPSQDDLTDPIV